jgi:hypothetical protein
MPAMHLAERRSILPTIKQCFTVFDGPLALIVFLILSVGMLSVYSAAMDFPGRFEGHMRNILVAFVVMWAAALVPPQTLMRFAVPLYVVGVGLLVAVALFGIIKNGSRRWINIGCSDHEAAGPGNIFAGARIRVFRDFPGRIAVESDHHHGPRRCRQPAGHLAHAARLPA